jgi:dUTP pyrophosphatase
MKLKYTKADKNLPDLIYKEGNAGIDLTAYRIDNQGYLPYVEYDTGIAVEIPDGFVGLLFPRSSVTKKGLYMGNSVGVVDSSYRGNIRVRFYNTTSFSLYRKGERIAQLVIVPTPSIQPEEVKDLSQTERGVNGFGSTGF